MTDSDAQEPFRLEDEPEETCKRVLEPIAPGAPEGNGRSDLADESPTAPRPAPERAGRSGIVDPEVDERTVAEKLGRAVEVVAGRRPPPRAWPSEAFVFPLRGSGRAAILGGASVWVLLDLASRLNVFLGLLLKMIAIPLFLRWQLHVASRSAAGLDEPARWGAAMDVEREHLVDIGRLLVAAVALLAPGIVAGALGRPWLAVALLGGGGLWLAAGALGGAVGDPRLLRPWHALAWIGRRPLGLLGATAGWWAFGLAEWAVHALTGQPLGLFLVFSALLRVACVYLLLVSARVLGVVGRAWNTPSG